MSTKSCFHYILLLHDVVFNIICHMKLAGIIFLIQCWNIQHCIITFRVANSTSNVCTGVSCGNDAAVNTMGPTCYVTILNDLSETCNGCMLHFEILGHNWIHSLTFYYFQILPLLLL